MDEGERLQSSARGWHTIQLAVLGFVGLCGVLKSDAVSSAPRGLEAVAGVLVLVGLALACLATYLVGRTAWPLPGRAVNLVAAGRRLRWGLVLTFLAVVLVALAAASAWWPAAEGEAGAAAFVQVSTSAGTACGTLAAAEGDGVVRLVADGQHLDIPVERIAGLTPVDGC
ncbi:hypothetical protein ACFPM3_15955 [Streptomyces coeruleoprunus]|uniref:Uncharacterized protein n=1 Tax=Streptomyces coeruleoprunus TaxID=285563 RepID=A0ABV9XFX1_9ACTN